MVELARGIINMHPESKHIFYKSGYKYQVTRSCWYHTGIFGYNIKAPFITLSPDGVMCIQAGYASDGPSGPTIDTSDSMRGAIGHDGLYELMRRGLLPQSHREQADKKLREWCLVDGMDQIRADIWYEGVREFAKGAASPENHKKEIKAP